MVPFSSDVTRSLNDYQDWLEAEYDIRIEIHDLTDSIVESLDQYQAEFNAMVLNFYGIVDDIEKRGFDASDSIEEDYPPESDEKIDEVLGEVRMEILKEARRLAERVNSLNLQPQWVLSPHTQMSVNDRVGQRRVKDNTTSLAGFQFLHAWVCAEGCGRIEGPEQYERHGTLYPNHHPEVSAAGE